MSKIRILGSYGQFTLEQLKKELSSIRGGIDRMDRPRQAKKIVRTIDGWINSGSAPDDVKDALYIARLSIQVWREYALYWNCLKFERYEESWSNLQNCIDTSRLFLSLNGDDSFHIGWILGLSLQIEELYPHKIFASTETVCDVRCSICGNDPLSDECPHMPGRLYAGQLMREIVVHVHSVPAISLVESPEDKRCIIRGLDHSALMGVATLYFKKRWSPLWFSGLRWSEGDGRPHVDIEIDEKITMDF